MAIPVALGTVLTEADIKTGVTIELTMASRDTLFIYERGVDVAVFEVVTPDWRHRIAPVEHQDSFDLTYDGQVVEVEIRPDGSTAAPRFKAWQA